MVPDAEKDSRRAVLWLAASAVLFLLLLAVAAALGLRPDWREQQRHLREAGFIGPRLGRASQITDACTGQTDRCITCHPGKDDGRGKTGQRDLFLDAHAPGIAVHFDGGLGCSVCHGGTGRALDREAAHRRHGEAEPLLRAPFLEASCIRCHVPGEGGTERLRRGAMLYLELGCQMCHPLNRRGLGGWDFGPDLFRPGWRSPTKLERSLLEPTADFPESTMPSFAPALASARERLDDLLLYLLGLPLLAEKTCPGPRAEADSLAAISCTHCHAGESGRASGRLRHRCPYILSRVEELRCSGCHHGEPPPESSLGLCPVKQHRQHCQACHLQEGAP